MSTIYVNEPATNGKICLKTTVGDIDIELWSKECPLAARNFTQLCMEGYYNGTIFHRLVKDFIVQGGDPTNSGQGGESVYGKPFRNEYHQRLKFNRRGLLGTAAGEDGLNGSQFFFTLSATPDLDKKHTLFAKVVGNTLFNMLRLGECETDENEKPVSVQKIIGTEVLNNPFPDIVPRRKESKKRKEKHKIKDEKQNLTLLSFGYEAEEDEIELQQANDKLKRKGKSAHDVLDDEMLSKECALSKEELEEMKVVSKNDDQESETRIRRIREKLNKRKRKNEVISEVIDGDEDEDLEKIVKQEMSEREQQQFEEIAEEMKSVHRDLRAMLKTKKVENESPEEKPVTEALKKHNEMKKKFKENSRAKLKAKDSKRQDETMSMLEKLMAKHDGIKSITENITGVKTIEINKEVQVGKMDLDNEEDLNTEELLVHKFIAPEEQKNKITAKDANLREESEDWYDINDPRNKMNQRRRGV